MSHEELTSTVLEWFAALNYEYMILHIIVCYGLYYSENLRWISLWYSPIRKQGRSKAIWLIGAVLALIEIIEYFPWIGTGSINYKIIVNLLHSYIVIQVFVEPIVLKIHNLVTLLKKVDATKKTPNVD